MRVVSVALLLSVVHELAEGTCDASKLAGSNPKDYCKYKLQSAGHLTKGDACMAHPEDLKPTQAAFGEVDANCERINLEALANKGHGHLKAYLMDKPAPAVLGPDGNLYITDHHHLSHALLSSFLPYKDPRDHRAMFVCITEDLSSLAVEQFWEQMKSSDLVWLHDERGSNITVEQLPSSVKYLRDDPYRTLAEWSRNSFGFVKCGKGSVDKKFPQCNGGVVAKPFIEFRWGNIYRNHFMPAGASDGIYIESDQQQVSTLTGMLQNVIDFSISEDNNGTEGWNQKQYTAIITLDDHGCTASSTSASQLVV